MAMVHSRVSRVVFGRERGSFGALSTFNALHLEQRLNHRYEVFTGLLREECASLQQYGDDD